MFRKAFILSFFLLLAASFWTGLSAQKITLDLDNVSVRELLYNIEEETGLAFFYSNNEIDVEAKVSVHVKGVQLEEVLRSVLPGVRCIILEERIILIPERRREDDTPQDKDSPEPLDSADSLRLHPLLPMVNWLKESVVVGYGVQQKANVTGAVSVLAGKELKDRPVSGVGQVMQGMVGNLNILQESGQPGAISLYNIRGKTSLNGGDPLILVDGVETDPMSVNPSDIESISILKDASSSAIYGIRGAFGVILITTRGGEKDTAPKVVFNARYSLSANTVSTDFETRGYDAAKLADTFMLTSVSGIPYTKYTDYDYQRLYDRRGDKVEVAERPWVIKETRDGIPSYTYLGNFDWYHYLYDESRPTQDYNIDITGGSRRISYKLSGRYYDQRGIQRHGPDRFRSYTLSSRVQMQLRSWLSLGYSVRFYQSDYSYLGLESQYINFYRPTIHALPSFVPENPDGTSVSHTVLTNSSAHYIMSGYNSMIRSGNTGGNNSDEQSYNTLELTADILPGLVFKTSWTYHSSSVQKMFRSAPASYSMYPGETAYEPENAYEDYLSERDSRLRRNTADAFLTYEGHFAKGHHLTAVAGVNYEDWRRTGLTVQRKDLLSETMSDFNLATGELKRLNGGVREYSLAGVFYRLSYDWKGRYLVETNGRLDGSSRFPAGKKWGLFPSVSFGWQLSGEPFWAPLLPVVSQAKLRASVGSLGNQSITEYAYWQTIRTGGTMNYSFDGETRSRYAEADDPVSTGTWETIQTKNLGADFGFFGGKLRFTGDFYIRDALGILTSGPLLPSFYGASEPMVNAHDIRTRGCEFSLEWNDTAQLLGKPLSYGVTATLSDYISTYTRCDNPSGLLSEPYPGRRLGEIWGYRVDGLFADDAEAAAYAAEVDLSQVSPGYYYSFNEASRGVRGGDMKYVDLKKDGVIDAGKNTLDDHGDLEVIGNSLPRWSYGLRFHMAWNGWDAQVFFQGIGHMDWYPGHENMRFWGPYCRPYASFVPKGFMDDVWSEDNPDAYFPRPRGYAALNASGGSLYYTNSRYLQNLAYLRLKNLSVGYTIPVKRLSRTGISDARICLSGENLLTWSAVHGNYIDPEQISADGDRNGNTYPWYRVFSLGITLTF